MRIVAEKFQIYTLHLGGGAQGQVCGEKGCIGPNPLLTSDNWLLSELQTG